MRVPSVLVPVLAFVLALVAVLADRALVGQAEATRAAAVLRLDEDAQLAAQSVQSTLAEIEQEVVAGKASESVARERLALIPSLSVAPRGFIPYSQRTRAELADLLSSNRATPNGLPEAVVARLAQDDDRYRSTTIATPQGSRVSRLLTTFLVSRSSPSGNP